MIQAFNCVNLIVKIFLLSLSLSPFSSLCFLRSLPLPAPSLSLSLPCIHQLLAGADDRLLKELQLEKDPSKYRYLTGSGTTAASLSSSDDKIFADVLKAMTVRTVICIQLAASQIVYYCHSIIINVNSWKLF